MTKSYSRLAVFDSLPTHAWYAKHYRRLKPAEVEFCRNFIRENDALDKDLFERAVNRMFLDRPELREQFRLWTTMTELCAMTNVRYPRHD